MSRAVSRPTEVRKEHSPKAPRDICEHCNCSAYNITRYRLLCKSRMDPERLRPLWKLKLQKERMRHASIRKKS